MTELSLPQTPAPGAGGHSRGLLLRREGRELARLAGPVILSQLGGIGMNTLDTIMVGPLGPVALAAAGLASALHIAVLMVCTGTIMGMAPLVSQAFGAGDRQRCRDVLVQGLWLALALSVPMTVFNLLGEPIALALGQDAEVARLVGGYMHALTWGVVPVLVFFSFRQFLEGMNRTAAPMAITFVGLACNFFANRAFIYGVPGWIEPGGVVGSGWATTVVRWVMLAALAAYLLSHREIRPFRGVHWAPEPGMLRRLIGIGAPTGAQTGLEVGLFTFAAVMMGWFGALELGTHQVTLNIAATTFMVALGASIAGSIRVGQHIGAGNHDGVQRAVIATYVLAVGSMGLFALLFLAVPEALLGFYSDDPDILRLGRQLLLVAAAFQLFDGAQVAGFSVLRGAADTRVPMILAAVSYWAVGALVAYLLGFHTALGPIGVWIGLSAGLAAAAVLLLARVRRVLW